MASENHARRQEMDDEEFAVLSFFSRCGDEQLAPLLRAAFDKARDAKLIRFVDCCDGYWALTNEGRRRLEKRIGRPLLSPHEETKLYVRKAKAA